MKNTCKHEVFIIDKELGKICKKCGLLYSTIKYLGEDVLGVNVSGTQSRRTPPEPKSPAERIRETWQELKELKRLGDGEFHEGMTNERYTELSEKFEELDILFGKEDSLLKAIIYYLNNHGK